LFSFHSGYQIEKNNDTGEECSTYGGRGKVCTGFWWGDLREREHLENLGTGGRIILRWIFSKWDGNMDWILSQDRNRWCAVVNAVMNLRVAYNVGNFLTI
jgi:hypothetical protein